MATPATLNTWLDELSLSIIQKVSQSRNHTEKRLQDTFRRRVKRHTNVRTNQFEVIERLDGLEEKFQILTLDNLSDALHLRRRELKDFEHHWLPDVLDLFLHLSGDPARNENLLQVYRVPPRIGTPPPLRWKDVLADDPVDRNDRLWRVPDFRDTDDSGYDDEEDQPSSSSTSPQSRKQKKVGEPVQSLSKDRFLVPNHEAIDGSQLQAIQTLRKTPVSSEIVFLREMLFILRGYPSDSFSEASRQYVLTPNTSVRGLSSHVLGSFTTRIGTLRQQIDFIQSWIAEDSDFSYIEAMKDASESVLNWYKTKIDAMQQSLIDAKSVTTASMIRVLHEVEDIGSEVACVTTFLEQADPSDPVSYLDALSSATTTAQACGDAGTYRVLLSLLIPCLKVYLEPLWVWLQQGRLETALKFFFVQSNIHAEYDGRLWHNRFVLIGRGPARPARFLTEVAGRILSCGKTASFIQQLSSDYVASNISADLLTISILKEAHNNDALPVIEALRSACTEDVNKILATNTQTLKSLLSSRCGISQSLDAVEQIYLGSNTIILGDVEPKIFDRIDRCIDGWNDRFQLRDMLEVAFGAEDAAYTVDALSIHSKFTSSRTMQSRRNSVKILGALSFEYRLTWPLANIIDEASMKSYRRIALTLMQIRRARYSLHHKGYLTVMNLPISGEASPSDQTFAQVLAFTLLSFIDTLYDCLTSSVIKPLTKAMRDGIDEALTVDDMISIHQGYIQRLQSACLVAPKLKTLHESLISILDLGIRFADLVSNSTKASNGDSDGEVGSFTSAFSRYRSGFNVHVDSDSESDEQSGGVADGYSSFVVLDEDTSVINELRKLKAQFQRHLKFFVAGLQGASRAGHDVQDLGVLAERLTWNQLR